MEELLEALRRAEATVDEMLKDGRMPEEKAWECYYSLAFEREINGLDDYRKALHKKIIGINLTRLTLKNIRTFNR